MPLSNLGNKIPEQLRYFITTMQNSFKFSIILRQSCNDFQVCPHRPATATDIKEICDMRFNKI